MREFNLRNNIGEEYRLNSLDNFFHSPEGLGFQRNAVYQKIGTRYEIVRDGFRQQPISGQIMFKSDERVSAYNRYLKFKNFLQEIPLTLVYRIPGGEFKMDVVPNMVEKTEINSSLGMNVGIELMPLSMWYKEVSILNTSGACTVESDSVIESPCCISFTGAVKSNQELVWEQIVDGTLVTRGRLTGVTLYSDEKVFIRTDTDPYGLYKVAGGNIISLYEKSDFSTKRFPFIRKGSNYFTLLATSVTEFKFEGRILYETV